MSLIAGQAGGGEPPSGLSAFKTVGSQLAVSAGEITIKKVRVIQENRKRVTLTSGPLVAVK